MSFSQLCFLPFMLVSLLIACLSPKLVSMLGTRARWIILMVPMAFTCFFSLAAFNLSSETGWKISYPWISLYETGLSFSLDGPGLLFSLLISFFGLLIIIFSGDYLKGHRDLGKFYFFVLIFMLSMIGLVLADHLILLFVFWELTTFSSFLLIGFDHQEEKARASAWQALLITTGGGLAMLAGFILLGTVCGTFTISEILQQGEVIRNSDKYFSILLLILLGAFTKSAQFPFYFWLPGAMAAPTPVSAYLHSATMVKAGIYLLARFSPVLNGTQAWLGIVPLVGAVTMLIGAVLALKQDDLKLLLAYMTVMALGTLTLLLGLGSEEALKAAIVFLIVHSFYKGALFLVTGAIDHGAGTRKISELGGLYKIMPWTAAAAFLSLVSMAGLPPMIGFVGKEMIYKAALKLSGIQLWTIGIISVSAMAISAGLAATFFFKIFFGPIRHQSEKAHENSATLWGPPFLLGMAGLLLGLMPSWLETNLIRSTVNIIQGEASRGPLFAGTKWDAALALSLLSTLLGVAVFLLHDRIKNILISVSRALAFFSPAHFYQRSVELMLIVASWITRTLQSGYQIKYLSVIFLTIIISLLFFLWRPETLAAFPSKLPLLDIYEWMIVGIMIVAIIASLLARGLLTLVLLIGVVGYGIALLFVIYGAPDLALTQFLIETLTIILIALIAIKFPRSLSRSDSWRASAAKGSIALAFGGLMATILWTVTNSSFDPYLSHFYAEKSYSIGKGRNIVNVILVDFRAMDTLGEITVLAIGGLGFYSLIKLAKKEKDNELPHP